MSIADNMPREIINHTAEINFLFKKELNAEIMWPISTLFYYTGEFCVISEWS